MSNPVPSDKIEDGKLNFGTADVMVNSDDHTVTTRTGKVIRTFAGINAEFDAAQAGQFVAASQDAADRAETAAEVAAAAGRVYETSAAGQADSELVDGDYFWVVSAADEYVLELWQKGVSSPSNTGKTTINEGFLRKDGELAQVVLPSNEDVNTSAPNLSIESNSLTFFGDTAIVWRGKDHSLSALTPLSIDLSVTSSTVKKVYFNTIDNSFLVLGFNQHLTRAQASVFALVCIVRRRQNRPHQSSISITCPYLIDGVLAEMHHLPIRIIEQARDRIAVILPMNGAPINLDNEAETLSAGNDTLFRLGNLSKAFANGFSVDLSVVSSTARAVYYSFNRDEFKVAAWNGSLSFEDRNDFALLAVIRSKASAGNPSQPSMDISCRYSIDGANPLDLFFGERVAIISGTVDTEGTPRIPNLDNQGQKLQFFADTVFKARNHHKVFSSGVEVDLSTASSSARLVYYSFVDDDFLVLNFSSNLSVPQRGKYFLVAFIRSVSTTTQNPRTVTMDIGCPYTIDNKPFGLDVGEFPVQNPLDATVRGVAHRGFSAVAPECTLPAYRLAKEKGFSYVEVDIQWTSDNVPVCLHDSTIDRTSDGTGAINELTFAQAREFDYGSWKSAEYAGTEIPTLGEFLLLCKKLSLHAYVELKGTITTAQAEIVAEEVKKRGMINDVTFIAFSLTTLQRMLAEITDARVGYLGTLSESLINAADDLRNGENEVFLNVSFGSVTTPLAEDVLLRGMELEAYTVNNSASVVPLVELGVSGITTDLLNINEILFASENVVAP